MANLIEISRIVSNLALAEFQNNNSFVMTAFRGYEQDFPMPGYKQGDIINIRKQNFAVVNDGRIATPYDINEQTESLQISHQYNTMIEVSSRELTLDLDTRGDYFNERYIRPAIADIIKTMETQIAIDAINQLNFAVGVAGTSINSFAAVDQAGVKLLEQAVDIFGDAYMGLSLRDASALKSSLSNNFNDTLNQDISFASQLGHLSYFDLFQNQSIRTHTTGSQAGTILVNGAVATGNTIVMDGATPSQTGVFRKGDVVSFTGVNSVNPIDKSDTGSLMQFVVLADANSTAGGAVTIQVSPTIDSDPSSTRRNVTTLIPDNAPVSILGVTSPGTPKTYTVNVAYPKRGLSLVVPPMELIDVTRQYVATDKTTNVSLRVGFDADIKNDIQSMRIDVLCGWKWHPEYATKVIS